MLDDNHQPPARFLAQMRAYTQGAGLPDAVADAMAQVPEMSLDRAKKLGRQVKPLMDVAKTLKVETGDVAQMLGEVLADEPEIEADAFKERMLDGLSKKVKAQGDDDIPMYGRPTDRTAGGVVAVGDSWERGEGFRAKAVAGLVARLDPKGDHGDMARDGAQMTLPDIAMNVCRMQGLRPFNEAEAVRMAHSTSDFPLILENSMTNLVARKLEQRMPDIIKASHEVQRADYRSGNSLTLSATGMPQEVNEGGEIKFVTAEENGELLPQLRDFASGFNITNKALVNDSTALGMLNDIGNRMVQGSVERLRAVLLEPIEANSGAGQTMADSKAMFHTDHGNLASSGAAISVTTLSAARTAMRKQKGLNGELYAIEPWALIVPPELETTAQQVLATINATKTSDANPFQNSLELIVEPGLSDAAAWYLIGNPASYDGLAHAFLDGQSSPRVETRPGWHTLGTEMRLVWALDAKFIETATWYRNPGA